MKNKNDDLGKPLMKCLQLLDFQIGQVKPVSDFYVCLCCIMASHLALVAVTRTYYSNCSTQQ